MITIGWLVVNFGGFLLKIGKFHKNPMKELATFWQYTLKSKHDTEVVSHQPAKQSNSWLVPCQMATAMSLPEAARHQRCHSIDVAWIF